MKVYSVLLGCGAGVAMAIVVLFFLIQNQYRFLNFGYWMIVVIGTVLPTVLHPLEEKGFAIPLSKRMMIFVSFVIGLAYAIYVTQTNTYGDSSALRMRLMGEVSVIHAIAGIATFVQKR